jgi:hypothetical protein
LLSIFYDHFVGLTETRGETGLTGPLNVCSAGFFTYWNKWPKLKKISLQHLLVFFFPGLIMLPAALVGDGFIQNGRQSVNRVALQAGMT